MKKVLIVDDAAFIRGSLKLMLEKNGYNVIGQAADGLEGVKLFRSLKPDIVTMDITMPNMNGLEALREIKKIDSSAKVVMVTALGKEELVKEAIVSGAVSFIVKPFNEDRVMSVVNKL